MYLVYLDETGNTGTDLSDSQQPIFVLSALIATVVLFDSEIDRALSTDSATNVHGGGQVL